MASDYAMHHERDEDFVDFPHADVNGQNKKKCLFHPSNTPGQFIKNAVTGVEYPWRTGSIDAQRLFKIVDTLGKCDSTGYKLKPNSSNYPNPSPNQCYYESPQQFMTHRRMTVQPLLIQQWEARQEMFKAQEIFKAQELA